MVVRIWHGVVPREQGYYFNKYLKNTRVIDITSSPGNLGIQVLRSVEHEKTNFILISYWESVESIKGYTGHSYTGYRKYSGDEKYSLEVVSISHNDLTHTSIYDCGPLSQTAC